MSLRSALERATADGFEYRESPKEARLDLADDHRLRGHAIVFNTRSVKLWSWYGDFFEIIKPEAVDRTINEGLDVRALIDHDTAKVLGRTTSGTLTLRKDRTGLKVEIDPPNTSYARDIAESVSRGDVSGMSFRFRVMPDGDSWEEEEDGTLIRNIHDMTVDEVSVVTFPAYLDTDIEVSKRAYVEVAVRSLEAHRQKQGGSRLEYLERLHKTRMARW